MTEQPGTAVLMFIAHRDAESRVMAALARAGVTEVTVAQSRLLQRLSPEGSRLTDLAEQARVTKQTAGALVDQLERAGYVVRQPDPSDARARLVTLSDRGAELCRMAAEEVAQLEDQWRDHLGRQSYEALRGALISLREITDPYR
ncbi:MarR family transcriptional regulator [Mycolicibacterium rufum]|uniref:MarR family transcriptional regulator n=1 Tax=Mycolicibacterium rufum TaxID=318424 RepID=A0A9X2YBL6_9MYCO|nr:MarR family transcriptional regulator [Mycolicibacterium rufum]KGI69284.1 MarR family transcriptional regulator [Mycolicibacterium rufum]MCV7070773.1 MarR family transcriptional regulator [Mycolicibacterium rufum]ULP35476.1 MarR family transcriptional regulator [Mycolicibacterium rufum]